MTPTYVLPVPPTASVAVADRPERFPVRRIFCVGKNYAAHAREMGGDPDREKPFFFCKPADAVVDDGATVPYPPSTNDLHHEVELVVAIAEGGTDIPASAALRHVWGFGVGIDLTRRDLQRFARDHGQPWDWAKGFDHSAPCGKLRPIAQTGPMLSGRIWLAVDGALRQQGDLSDLIWGVPEVISLISQSVALAPGDLIFTGTPAGVGPVAAGSTLVGGIDGLGEIRVNIG